MEVTKTAFWTLLVRNRKVSYNLQTPKSLILKGIIKTIIYIKVFKDGVKEKLGLSGREFEF